MGMAAGMGVSLSPQLTRLRGGTVFGHVEAAAVDAFVLEQLYLARDAAAEAGQIPACSYYAVARHDDADGVVADSSADSTGAAMLPAHAFCRLSSDIAICAHLAERYLAQNLPNYQAKLTADRGEFQAGNRGIPACEVFIEPCA